MERTILKLTRIPSHRKSLENLPEEAGVYLFFAKKTPIYIGKAINLKSRLSSYFTTNLAPKTAKMISEAVGISYIKVASELDSLLLEAKLIHDLQPRYNATFKDDKHPLYIRITKEKYPRILTARKIDLQKEPNLAFYGPFPSSWSVRSVLRMLRRIFPYSEHRLGTRPCLYSHIGLCDPCPNYVERIEDVRFKIYKKKRYLKNIRNIKRVLERKTNSVLKELYKQMGLLSGEEKFEEAKVIRDQIKNLEYISQPILPTEGFLENPNLLEDLRNEELKDLQKTLAIYHLPFTSLKRIECFDVAHLAGASPTASMVTFVGGEADKNFYRHFRIRQTKGSDDIASLREVARRRVKYFKSWGAPDLVIVDGGKGQVRAFSTALHSIVANYAVPVVGLAKQFETLVIPKGDDFVQVRLKDSPALHLVQRIRNEAHRFARRYHHLLLKKDLISYT